MNLAITVIEIVAPAFLLAAAGFAWVRLGQDYPTDLIGRLVMTVAIPCLIFLSLVETQIPPGALGQLALATVAAYATLTLIAFALVRLAGLDVPSFVAPLANGNTGNLGLPLAVFAFGDQALGYAVVVFTLSTIYAFTVGVWITSGRASLGQVMRQPLVLATLLGGVFLWNGWGVAPVVGRTLDLAGQIAVPMMLLTLGVAISRLPPGGLIPALGLAVGRVAICLSVGWAVGRLFALDPLAFAVLVLQLSTPVAITSYLVAQRYGADSQAVAALVLVSTLLSVITLPLTLAILI